MSGTETGILDSNSVFSSLGGYVRKMITIPGPMARLADQFF